MKITRSATAIWKGSGKEGLGELTTDSTVLNASQYSYKTRFEDGIGTNPEELIAAALAGCFCMKLAFTLQAKEFVADRLECKASASLENGMIQTIRLELEASVPNITFEIFEEAVLLAKNECPISKSLKSEITIGYSLVDYSYKI